MAARKLDVLMIAPKGYRFVGIAGEHAYFRLTKTNRFWPPLGLLTVAAHLPREWNVRIVDENVEEVTDADLARADFVMLSTIYPRIDRVLHNAERAAAHGKPVIVGGPCVGRVALRRGDHPSITAICWNECDSYIHELIADMERGSLRDTYGAVAQQVDLTKSPVPRFELLRNMKRYLLLAIQVSRGCPFKCDFCDVPEASGHKMRYKAPAQVVRELDALRARAPKGQVFLCDDNFVGHRASAKAVLEAVAGWQVKNGYPFSFISQLSLDVADDPEMLDLLFRANLRNAMCGIESVNEESLIEVGKKQNLKRSMRDRVEDMMRAGIEVSAYLLLGFDSDPPDIARRQLEFIQSAKIPWAFTNILFASDRTPFGRRMAQEGRLLFSAEAEPDRTVEHVTLGLTNFTTKIPARTLQESYAWLIEELYRPANWYRRTREMVEMLPERDREQQLVPLRWSPTSALIALLAFVFCPSRVLLVKEAFALRRKTKQSWRVWRYLISAFATGLSTSDYAIMARRIRASAVHTRSASTMPEPGEKALPAA